MSDLPPGGPRNPRKPLTACSRRVLNTLIWDGRLEKRRSHRGVVWRLFPSAEMPRWWTHGSKQGEVVEVGDKVIQALQLGGWLHQRFAFADEIHREDVPGWHIVADLFAGGRDDGLIDPDGALTRNLVDLPIYLQVFLSQRSYLDSRRLPKSSPRSRARAV